MIQGCSCNMHPVKLKTISNTLKMSKLKQSIKPKASKKLPKLLKNCPVRVKGTITSEIIVFYIVLSLILIWQSPGSFVY